MYARGDSTQMFTKIPSHPFTRHCFSNYRLYLFCVSSVTVQSHPELHYQNADILEEMTCFTMSSCPVTNCESLLVICKFIHEYFSYKNETCSNAQLCSKLKSQNIVLLCKQVLRDCLTIGNKDQCNIAVNPNLQRDCPQVQNFKH